MANTNIVINPDRIIGTVDKNIFGSFIENLQSCMYGGVYDPDSPAADEDGFRTDVIEATRAMGVSNVRFPGGCYAAYYHWKDGIGAKDGRPKTRYGKVETDYRVSGWSPSNDFGTDEFILWCRKVGAEPYICINMGSGTPEEARDWVEYCNHPAGSRWADRRIENGNPEPYEVKYWAIGNEISGHWELGYADTSYDYVKRAREYVRAMKHCDPSIRIVLAGSHFPLKDYLDANWNRFVMEELYEEVDYITLHYYVGRDCKSKVAAQWKQLGPIETHYKLSEYIAEADDAFRIIREDIRLVNHRKSRIKKIGAAMDEYNPWYRSDSFFNELYNVSDCLLVGSYFNSFIRNADIATLSNMAQLVNVLPALICKPGETGFFRQGISYVQEMYLANKTKIAIDAWSDSPTFTGDYYPEVPYLDISATADPETGNVILNVINRHHESPIAVNLSIAGRSVRRMSGKLLGDGDIDARNTFEHPDRLIWQNFDPVDSSSIEVPPLTVTVLEIVT